MYESDLPESSTLTAWLGLGASVAGLVPLPFAGYAIAIGLFSLFLSSIGVYDATRAGPDSSETDTLYPLETMVRGAWAPRGSVTNNAATLIRVHVVNQTTLAITLAKKKLLPKRVSTSDIFSDTSIAKTIFSVAMENPFEIRPFRIFQIQGLVPMKGEATPNNTWFNQTSVTFSRGEMVTIDTSTPDRKTMTSYGPLKVDYQDNDVLFKYNASTLFICVEDNQTLEIDNYRFYHISNTQKGVFLWLRACTVQGARSQDKIGSILSDDRGFDFGALNRLLFARYDIFWLTDTGDPRYVDLWAAKFKLDKNENNDNLTIQAKPNLPRSGVLILITNWAAQLRMLKPTNPTKT
jgi:hypothetical protein